MRLLVILTYFAAMLAVVGLPTSFVIVPHAAMAQEVEDEMPPMPRPRPNFEAGETSAPVDPTALIDPNAPSTPATEAITALTSSPQDVHLSARIVENGKPIPNGLVWRIFDTKTDASGQLAMVAKSDQADVHLSLPPGEYVVHVAYGQAQITDTLVVNQGVNDKSVIIEAGALRLNAAVAGDIAIPIDLLKFDIYPSGSDELSRQAIAENVAPNDIVTLNAGTYHVVSKFGSINAEVRADLRVEPGQMTEATLYHRAAQVGFKLVSEAGGEAIADVEWTVKTATGDTVFSEISAFPATVLAEGEYLVLAKRGETVYNRNFEITPGQPRDIEVLTTVY